ncbi:MAG: helix-turn-helix domain-containing protein [Burkholderiaceae bacterium]
MPAPTPQAVRTPRASLEQWQALISIVEAGGYAQAAQQLNKTQSAITYLIGRLEELLGIRLFERQGRRAVLTAAGQARASLANSCGGLVAKTSCRGGGRVSKPPTSKGDGKLC